MRVITVLLVVALGLPALADPPEEPESFMEEYECLAVDCRVLAGALGGGVTVEEPLAAHARALAAMREGRGGFLSAGFAPYGGDVFGQFGGGFGPTGPGAGGAGGSFIPEGLEPPLALVERNALILRGTREAIDQALELLRLIDKPAPMVRIDLQAISSPETFDEGRMLMWRGIGGDGTTLGASAGGGGGGLSLAWAQGDLGLAWNEFESRSRSHGEESLFITTESGLPAFIGVRYIEPSFIPERVYDRAGNIVTVYHVVYSAIETSLYVVPRVNGNGTVTMYLAPRFSGKVGEVTPPGGTPFPIIQERALDTLVTVRDRETFAIGGFKRIAVDETYQGQGPIGAGDLPRWRRSVRVENVTLFVTPTIIEQAGDGHDPIEDIAL